MITTVKIGRECFKSLAYKYKLDRKTFKKNIDPIRKRLDEVVGRSNYRSLVRRQVEIIIEHLGEWDEE